MSKADDPIVHVVRESFGVETDGVPITYLKGEPIHPDDPILKKHPGHFAPLEFPHPHKARGSFAQKMAEAKAAKNAKAPADAKADVSTGNVVPVEDAVETPEVRSE